jgi:hypothetical protein
MLPAECEERTMKFMLMLYADMKAGAEVPPDQMAAWMEKMGAYADALKKANAFVATARLAFPWEATTVHVENGEMKVHDGPYADTREQLGGYYFIEAPNMAEAQKWAAKCPAATWGSVEVRPIAG